MEMLGTLVYVSADKHSEAEQDRNQAVSALQTEPIVCRWAFNGPTAGHKELTAPACLTGLHTQRGGSSHSHRHRHAHAFHTPFFCLFSLVSHLFSNNCAQKRVREGPVAPWNGGLKPVLGVHERHSALLPTRVQTTRTNTCPNRCLELRPVPPSNAKGSAHAKDANTPKRHLAETCTHTNSCTLICSLRCPPFIAFYVSSHQQLQKI